MSTTKAKSLKEIKSKLGLMPSDVACMKDVNLCIDDLYEALCKVIKVLEVHLKTHKLELRETDDADRTTETD